MKKPIPIVLDSTVYKQVPKLNSPLFLELIRYCRVGQFQLFVPEIVESEYLTWILKETNEVLQSISRVSKSLSRLHRTPELFGIPIHIDMTGYFVGTHIERVHADILSNWDSFKKETEARPGPIEPAHGKNVMDAYFNGGLPFSAIKKRDDIPDAFIYFSLIDILKNVNCLILVSSDKGFLARVSNSKILGFSSLADVFTTPDFRIEFSQFSESSEIAKWQFFFQYFKEEILEKAENEVNCSDLIFDAEREYRNDVIGEYQETYTEVEYLSLIHEEVSGLYRNTFIVPFGAKIEVTVSSKATQQEWNLVDQVRRAAIEDLEINDNGDLEIKEKHATEIRGALSFQFADTDPMSWKPKKDVKSIFPEMKFEEILVTLESIEKST